MKKNGKIRSNFVKDSLKDFNNLATTLKENTESAVKDLLTETVLEQYAKILNESDDEDEYDVEEVEDTDAATEPNGDEEETVETDTEVTDDAADGMDAETETETETDVTDDVDGAQDETEEWSDFDKYKVDDDEYDFSNAEDDEIVKVYKLLKDDDQVVVNSEDDGKVSIKDNETGAEYLIDLGGGNADEEEGMEFEISDDSDNQIDNMDESKIFEIALNEIDSNVGYTDKYQDKDVLTNDGNEEPGKNVNDWDNGVPKGTKKPWSGKKNDKSENQPFDKTVKESEEIGADDEVVNELKTTQEHTANTDGTSRTDTKNNPRPRMGRNAHTAEKGQVTQTTDNPYQPKLESVIKKANAIFEENQQLKQALSKFKKTLEEAAVTNVNLGNIIKLVMENSTTKDEKKEIINRFGKEARTVEASKNLYEQISRDLKKNQKMNIDESKEYAVPSKINETQIYRSDDMLASLEIMHKICK